MARYMKKREGVREVAVPEIGGGVRTRKRKLSETVKRIREVGDGEFDLASAYMELRHTRPRVVVEETSSASCGPVASVEEPDCGFEPCSSNTSSDLVDGRPTMSDPEGQTESAQLETLTLSGGRSERICRSITSLSSDSRAEESDDMESMADGHWTDANTNRGSTIQERPSESEIEDFFTAAEKDLHKRFSEKYNFDVVKGLPLEGRYEWVPVKP